MKETKVWIDGEFPQVYFDPKTGNESIEGRPFILEDIKTHDRELVNEVCEKIIYNLGSIEDIIINLGNGKEDAFSYFIKILNKVQKEFEK